MVSFGEVEHVLMQAPGAANGDIISAVDFPDLSRFLTANATTPYTLTWLNLAKKWPVCDRTARRPDCRPSE